MMGCSLDVSTFAWQVVLTAGSGSCLCSFVA